LTLRFDRIEAFHTSNAGRRAVSSLRLASSSSIRIPRHGRPDGAHLEINAMTTITAGLTREENFMSMALKLALKGQGRVEPNPMVGCIIAKNGQVVGEGFHKRFGGSHAEVHAVADGIKKGTIDKESLAGCEVYVTLEPCAHFGKTPPCADMLAWMKPDKVFVAMVDPFPEVSGKGIKMIKDTRIPVAVGLLEDKARDLNKAFIKRVTTGLPYVIVKWAQTLDGKVATGTGQSKWISSPESREDVHRLRGRMDAIITGIGTVLKDDPLLTPRPADSHNVKRYPVRVIIDPLLEIPFDRQVLKSLETPTKTIIATSEAIAAADGPMVGKINRLTELGIKVARFPVTTMEAGNRRPRLDLSQLLKYLVVKYQATNVLLEAGGSLVGSFMRQRLVDELRVYIAPTLMGDKGALGCVEGFTPKSLADTTRLKFRSMAKVGDDVAVSYVIG
jgi:diaminohydroxyphosphoribosylaminopyrimidine deaminase / 5-amino-6-(5-phosphoribosylamino)uracil reductase